MTLSELLQYAIHKLGRNFYYQTTATAGSVSMFEDTKLEDRFTDDSLKNATLIVTWDAAGAAAAPQGEFTRITAYDSSTWQATLSPVLTSALTVGDEVMLVNASIPMLDLITTANDAMRQIGKVAVVDTSLVMIAGTYTYALPIAVKGEDLISVEYKTSATDEYFILPKSQYKVTPAAPGTAARIEFSVLPSSSWTVRLTYFGNHPVLRAFSDKVYEGIPDELAVLYTTVALYDWMGVNDDRRQAYNVLAAQLDEARRTLKVNHPALTGRALTWSNAYEVEDLSP